MKSVSPKRWTFVGIGIICVIACSWYLAGRDGGVYAIWRQASLPDAAGKESEVGLVDAQATVRHGLGADEEHMPQFSIEASADSFSRSKSEESSSIASDDDLLDLSPIALKNLHARQHEEIERMLGDIDSVVIAAVGNGGIDITLRELQILHERQVWESNSVYDGADIVIPAGADGYLGLSVSELRAIHDQQQRDSEAVAGDDEIIIPGSEDDSSGLSRADVTALHRRQNNNLENAGDFIQQNYVAPLPEGGDRYLTLAEIQGLHKWQSSE